MFSTGHAQRKPVNPARYVWRRFVPKCGRAAAHSGARRAAVIVACGDFRRQFGSCSGRLVALMGDARDQPGVRPMQTVRSDVMMELMSASAGALLFLREFSVNACEAIRDGGRDHGTAQWDVDARHLQAGGRALLCVIDDGIGMSAAQLVAYIGNLSSSGKDHRAAANHGVGAKIAGARFSPRGIEFRSWHQGHGSMVVLHRHPGGTWGLQDLCPEARGDARGGSAWTSGECAAVVGARALLAEHSERSGVVKLADASCHWWILRETTRPRARRPVAREWAATGYCGLLHRGEILEHAVGLQGAQRLGGMFKIRLGSQRG